VKRANWDTNTVLTMVEVHGPGAFGELVKRFPHKVVVAVFRREAGRTGWITG
jgi:hypothetical protein